MIRVAISAPRTITASTAKSEASGNPDRIALGSRYENTEYAWSALASGHSEPRTSRKYETNTNASVSQSLTQSVEGSGRKKSDCADRPEQERTVQPEERQLGNAEGRGLPGDRGPDQGTGDEPRDGETDEQRSGGRQRDDESASRDRPREQDLERSPLPLAGDRQRREPHSHDQDEGDRDRVDEPQRDGTRQAEQVAATELRELLELRRDRATGEDVLDDRAVRVVDDRQEHPPHDERGRHDDDPPDVRVPHVGEDGSVHARRPAGAAGAAGSATGGVPLSSHRTPGTPPRGAQVRS